METPLFSIYFVHRGIKFPAFNDVKVIGDSVLCPYCRKPMKLIYEKGGSKFFQCEDSHKGRRFVYMIGGI